jgi:hypothetical protein
MATIPISQIVQVTPSVLTAAGSALDLNGLLLTQSTYSPIGSVVPFASASDVGVYYADYASLHQPAAFGQWLASYNYNGDGLHPNEAGVAGPILTAQSVALSAAIRV